ncbi:MAG: aspartyl protease family protein [Isosphaerales bacterium]
MPHFTVMIGADRPVIDLGVAVGRSWQRRLATQGAVVPPATTVRALIDTGSDLSVVHPQILHQLGVQATGSIRIRRPGAVGGFRPASLSDVQLSIGGLSPGTLWVSTLVVSVAPSTLTVFALVGRDVLEHCTLFYNGPRRELTLSY